MTLTPGDDNAIGMEPAGCDHRNLFAEALKKTDSEIDAKLEAGYRQLFHGGSDQTLYYESGSGAYILDVNNNDVRSEGMSYGMMIAVQMDRKDEFHKLWTWAKEHMRQSSGMFGWLANPDGSLRSAVSAPDGEEYFATALIFAGKRWNDNTLLSEGKSVCQAMLSGGAFDKKSKLVKFVTNADYSDPSYVLPAFYEVWAGVDRNNRSFWKAAARSGRNFFHKACNSTTMLAPAMADFDGSPNSSKGYFESDAWRVVGNIMMDWDFFHADSWQGSAFAPTYAAFWKIQQTKRPMPDELDPSGTVRVTHADPAKALIAQNAMIGFGIPAADAKFFVQALWDMPIPTGNYRYYDGLLYLLAFLHVSGRFHLY
jgi:endo-1,4-beta-D-glucanase Y